MGLRTKRVLRGSCKTPNMSLQASATTHVRVCSNTTTAITLTQSPLFDRVSKLIFEATRKSYSKNVEYKHFRTLLIIISKEAKYVVSSTLTKSVAPTTSLIQTRSANWEAVLTFMFGCILFRQKFAFC